MSNINIISNKLRDLIFPSYEAHGYQSVFLKEKVFYKVVELCKVLIILIL